MVFSTVKLEKYKGNENRERREDEEEWRERGEEERRKER